jgi:hypothetical protein
MVNLKGTPLIGGDAFDHGEMSTTGTSSSIGNRSVITGAREIGQKPLSHDETTRSKNGQEALPVSMNA